MVFIKKCLEAVVISIIWGMGLTLGFAIMSRVLGQLAILPLFGM